MILQIKFLKKYFVKIKLNQNLTVNTAFHINKRPLNLYSSGDVLLLVKIMRSDPQAQEAFL